MKTGTTMRITVKDSLNSARRFDDNGFLHVPAKAARIGIQEYLGFELGMTGEDSTKVFKVYRSEDQVFNPESLATYKDVDITIEHPDDFVNSENFKSVSAGHVCSMGQRDGDWVICDLIIKDKDAIGAVMTDKAEVSMGYDMDLVKAPEGAAYDFEQTNLKMNHIALVSSARAGHEARVFDSKLTNHNKVNTMKVKLTDGLEVTFDSDEKAQLVKNAFDSIAKRLVDAEEEVAKMKEKSDKLEAEKDAAKDELEEEKKKSSDSAIMGRLKEVAEVKDAAAKIKSGFTTDSIDVAEIKRTVIADAKPSLSLDGKSDAYIDGLFDSLVESAKDNVIDKFGRAVNSNQAQDSQNKKAQDARSEFMAKRYGDA